MIARGPPSPRALVALVALATFVAIVSLVRAARAQSAGRAPEPPRLGLYVEGPDAARVRAELQPVASRYFEVVPLRDDAVRPHGWRGPVGPALTSGITRAPVVSALLDAAVAIHLRAVVVAVSDRAGAHGRLALYLLVPSRGDEVKKVEVVFSSGNAPKARAELYEQDVDPSLRLLSEQAAPHLSAPAPVTASEAARPAVKGTELEFDVPYAPGIDAVEQSLMGGGPQGEPQPPAWPARAPEPPREPNAAPLFDLAVGAVGENRWFSQKEPSFGTSQSYRGGAIVGPAVSAEIRALRFSPRLWWTVQADYWQAVALSSWSLVDNRAVGTTASRFGSKVRVHFTLPSPAGAFEAIVEGGFSRWTFDLAIASAPDLENPTGDYELFRAGLELRALAGPFHLFAGGGAGSVFATGALGDRTAADRPRAFDASFGAALSLGRRFEVRVMGTYTSFTYRLLPVPGWGPAPAEVTDAYLTYGASLHALF